MKNPTYEATSEAATHPDLPVLLAAAKTVAPNINVERAHLVVRIAGPASDDSGRMIWDVTWRPYGGQPFKTLVSTKGCGDVDWLMPDGQTWTVSHVHDRDRESAAPGEDWKPF